MRWHLLSCGGFRLRCICTASSSANSPQSPVMSVWTVTDGRNPSQKKRSWKCTSGSLWKVAARSCCKRIKRWLCMMHRRRTKTTSTSAPSTSLRSLALANSNLKGELRTLSIWHGRYVIGRKLWDLETFPSLLRSAGKVTVRFSPVTRFAPVPEILRDDLLGGSRRDWLPGDVAFCRITRQLIALDDKEQLDAYAWF